MQVDPEADSFFNISPYSSMVSNPINYKDPNGDTAFTGVELAANVAGVLVNAFYGEYQGKTNQFFMDLGMSIMNGLIAEANPADWNMGIGSVGVSLTFQGGSEGVSLGIEAGVSVGTKNVKFLQLYGGVTVFANNYGTNTFGGNAYIGAGIGVSLENAYFGNSGFGQILSSLDIGVDTWFRTTQFFDFAGETTQRVGGFHLDLTVGNHNFGAYYLNDGFPFEHLRLANHGSDAFRTASLGFFYGDYSINVNLFTGDRNLNEDGKTISQGGIHYPHGIVPTTGANKYREGILTIGYKELRVGWNAEGIRHAVQNQFAHDIAKEQDWFLFVPNMPNRPVIGTDFGSKYHTW